MECRYTSLLLKKANRQWFIDNAVQYAWETFGESVGWRSDCAVRRLTQPDAINFIVKNFRYASMNIQILLDRSNV